MGFLSNLGNVISAQFGLGDNTSSSVDGVLNSLTRSLDGSGNNPMSNIDETAERYYLEDGFIRDLRPRTRSILFQQPDIYVVVKKRMFSTLVDNSRLDLLEKKERILIAASKRLFQNKCRLLSAYERLVKIEQFSYDSGRVNSYLSPQLFSILDSTSPLFNATNSDGKTKAALDTLRRIISYSEPGDVSNWTTNTWDAVYGQDIGEGPGTFELTNVVSVRTTANTEWGGGNASLSIEDPYNILTVTEADIDQAISDVTNPMRTSSFFKSVESQLQQVIEDLKQQLSEIRAARLASQITFKISPGSITANKVRAIIDAEGVEIVFQYSTGIQNAFSGLQSSANFVEAAASVGSLFSNGGVQIEPQFLSGNASTQISSDNQLTPSETKIFAQIIANIFTLINQRETSQRELRLRNADVNYARNRMRLFFNGKFIIQPMDTVTIWMTTRTGEDQRQPGGFQSRMQAGSAQQYDSILKNLNSQVASMNDLTGNFAKGASLSDVERIAMVGPDMPKWLWNLFRQDITSQPTGPCIFSGVVGPKGHGVSGNWSDGKWTITVNCEDHTAYFDMSMINFKPAADVFNSSIYDPLTPFDISFDAATGVPATSIGQGDFPPLLPENQKLILSGIATFRSGPNKGSSVTEDTYKSPTKEISFGDFRAVLHDPAGMVYRWKQGIQTLTESSRPNKFTDNDQERTVLLTNQPFAGQDIMNVISVLVTGQPYNYETFLKSAIANGNSLGFKDNTTNMSSADTYIQGLVSDIDKVNQTWGNFVPYKKLVINPTLDSFITQQKFDIITLNTNISQKLTEQAKLQDELTLQTGFSVDPNSFISRDSQGRPAAGPQGNATNTAINTKLQQITAQINAYQQEFNLTIMDQVSNNKNLGLTLVGNEVNANPSLSSIDDASSTVGQKQQDERNLRRNLFRFTARRFWQTRANEDKNLFIVDDQYDKNLDIQAFERKIGGKIDLFNSHYSTIGEQISGVKKLLGLECFANTQGHIEVRPPQYNKMPSSVFYKMFRDRDLTGVKVFPDFLENLYFNQIRGIFNQLEIIEDEIRLRAVALGSKNDLEIMNLITGQNGTGGPSFSFLTNFNTGKIGDKSLQQLFAQGNPDFADSLNNNALQELVTINTSLSTQSKIAALFTPSIQASALTKTIPKVDPDTQSDIIDQIRDRLRIKTGREPKTLQDLFGNPQFRRINTSSDSTRISQVDKMNVLNQIGNFLSERQTMIKSVSNAIRNLQEGVSTNATDVQNQSYSQGGPGNIIQSNASTNSSQVLSTPYLNRKAVHIPQFLEHMIEDEDIDDIGIDSGKRYVLSPDRIISMTISENPPPFTMVTVKGLVGEGFIDAPSSLGQTDQGGNAVTSAYAVDYDMWYQYGLKVGGSIEAPFLSDPDSQCAPYAVATLLQARENILQGSVEVAGYNEYYQPGDVVYIEDRNLLFYVKSVIHNFSYGKLSTTLELNYGHSPGEYIPTMLDVVGKIMYNSKGFSGQFRSHRSELVGNARSIGALSFVQPSVPNDTGTSSTRTPTGTDILQQLISGPNGQRNQKVLTDALFSISGSMNQVSFRNKKTRIKIVYYVTKDSNGSEMLNAANAVYQWFLNPESNDSNGNMSPINQVKDGSSKQRSFGLNSDDLIIEEVDMSDPNQQTRQVLYPQEGSIVKNNQGPSSAAVQIARINDSSGSTPSSFATLLANTVIDIFVDYQSSVGTASGTGVQTGEKRGQCTTTISENGDGSQSSQSNNSTINSVRNSRGT